MAEIPFNIPTPQVSVQKVGELLVKHTSLRQEQLDEALEIQKDTGELLGQILLKKNYITNTDINKAICLQMAIPYTEDFKADDINPEIIQNLTINYCKLHQVIPLFVTDESVTVAMTDPFKAEILQDLRTIFNKDIIPVVSSPLKVNDAINRVFERANKNLVENIEGQFEEDVNLDGPIDILDASGDEAPVIKFVNSIIFRAVKERASDIHIEPYERESIYRFRINRVMTEIMRQPIKTHASVSSRIKVMGRLDIAEKRIPQDGRIKIKIAGKDIDIRLSTVPVQNGERIVMRVLEKTNTVLRLEKLGFHGQVLKNLDMLSQLKHGVVYVSGPTGHGKTTTLFAMLERINTPDRMIITVEDPVEYELNGISQIQVNSKIELTFAKALRSILRQNPDVIMVGETRDYETAEMAIQASLTGHFVLSTIHTNDAASAPTRLIDMGVQPFLIASSLTGVLAQRLIRVLCEQCKKPHIPTDFEKNLLGIEDIPPNATVCIPQGCPACGGTGYAGLTCVAELMMVTDDIKGHILRQADSSTIKRAAIKNGMITLRQDAITKVFQGKTSIDEMVRAINDEEIVS